MIPPPPPGQGPIDPSGVLIPPPAPGAVAQSPASANPLGGATRPPTVPAPPPAGGPLMQMQTPPAGGFVPPPGIGAPGGFGYPPPPRRGGRWKSVLLVIAILLLIGSVFFNILLVAGDVRAGGGSQTIVAGDASEEIAVIPLDGVIDESTEARLQKQLSRAQDDSNVKGVILLIDTPGGSVTASDEIYKSLLKFKTEKGVNLAIAMRGMATSGGYYAACAGDYISAESTTLTGNIGVIMSGFNFSKLADKYGIAEHTLVSTGATYKNAGSMFQPQNPRDDAYLQDIIDSAFTRFKAVVQTGRANKLTKPIDEIANGKAYTADTAKALGLIDVIDDKGYLDSAVAWLTTQAHLTKPQVVKYQELPSLMELLTSSKFSVGGASAGGVSINIDAQAIDRLRSPRAMYLFRLE